MYESEDASEIAERIVHHASQSPIEISLESNLSLSTLDIGDKVIVEFFRLAKNRVTGGDRKIFSVFSLSKDGSGTKIKLTDNGNLYHRSSLIAPDDAPDYTAATTEEKETASYITDDNGLITGYQDTVDSNLIA